MSEWLDATVYASRPAAHEMTAVTLLVDAAARSRIEQTPGQFVKVVLEPYGEAFFAIASSLREPGNAFELLVKHGTPLADALAALPLGAQLRVSVPSGPGFPMSRARGKNVLLFASGSGISAIRSVIEKVRHSRAEFKDVVLYFGARSPGAFAYVDELDTWARSGIRVLRTVSQPASSGWEGLTGYVQAHLPHEPLENAVAFLCGPLEMVSDVTHALLERGMRREDIYVNY